MVISPTSHCSSSASLVVLHFIWVAMEREKNLGRFLRSLMLVGLISQCLVAPVTCRRLEGFSDQKNYYSAPTPHTGSSPQHSHKKPSCATPSHHGGSYRTPTPSTGSGGSYGIPTPSHGGSYGTPTPSQGGGGYYNSPPSGGGSSSPAIIPPPSTPVTEPPVTTTPTPTPSGGSYGTPTPSHGAGGYYNSPPSGGSSSSPVIEPPPVTTTPSTPTPIGGSYGTPTPSGGSSSSPVIEPPVSTTPSTPTPTIPGISTPSPFLPDPGHYFTGTCDYWRNHPDAIWAIFGYSGTVGQFFGVACGGIFGKDLSLTDALANTRTDGVGALLREGTASFLNSLVNKRFPFTTRQVKDSMAAAATSNKAAAAQAELFKKANEGRLRI